MVRESVARHLRSAPPTPASDAPHSTVLTMRTHSSHGRLRLLPSGADDGACVIEPSVRCTHCGYCQSYGH